MYNNGATNSSRFTTYQYKQQQRQQLAQLAQEPPTRLLYQIVKATHAQTAASRPYWKANELWKKYDKHKAQYAALHTTHHNTNTSANLNRNMHVLIIGCGPVGLRLSIECAFMGIKCTIVEKRDRFSRNNVLHLWPYTIVDLKNLGAKLFYGKFCAGSIDHISIRKLQCILLKVALLVGVQIHFNTSFEQVIEPASAPNSAPNAATNAGEGWRVKLLPENHPLSACYFDCIIGADGRRNTLPGFKRKEFRGRLAIGEHCTATF